MFQAKVCSRKGFAEVPRRLRDGLRSSAFTVKNTACSPRNLNIFIHDSSPKTNTHKNTWSHFKMNTFVEVLRSDIPCNIGTFDRFTEMPNMTVRWYKNKRQLRRKAACQDAVTLTLISSHPRSESLSIDEIHDANMSVETGVTLTTPRSWHHSHVVHRPFNHYIECKQQTLESLFIRRMMENDRCCALLAFPTVRTDRPQRGWMSNTDHGDANIGRLAGCCGRSAYSWQKWLMEGRYLY